MARTSPSKHIERMGKATTPINHNNTVTIAVHVVPDGDGCEGIVDYLRWSQKALNARQPIRDVLMSQGPFFVDTSYPDTAAIAAAKLGIPPHLVTNVLLLIPAFQPPLTISDLYPGLNTHVYQNQPTAIGLGRVDLLDPDSRCAKDFQSLGDMARRTVNYLESYYDRAVQYISTGPSTVIDRSL